MIGKFWDRLFDYGDQAKEQGDMVRYKVCHEIADILQQTYDEGIKSSSVIKGRKPKTRLEALVLSIPDIKVYKDPNDGQIWYELECEDKTHKETSRYDYPEEVLKKIVEYRTNRLTASMGAEREVVLSFMINELRNIRAVEDVMKKNGNKNVETRSRK